MIDTIRLRLYGILDDKTKVQDIIAQQNAGLKDAAKYKPVYVSSANNELYRRMVSNTDKNKSLLMVYNREVNTWDSMSEEEFITVQNKAKISHHHQVRQRMRIVEEGQVKDINMKIRGKYRVTSSFSDIVYQINENGSFIDFEFSIPKYLYGHNLAEFIPQGGSKLKLKDPLKLLTFSGQRKYLFDRLDYIINLFLEDLQKAYGCEETPDKNYLEVRRIDLCYNQYFDSEKDALAVLEEQKKINMRRQRKNANISRTYDSSLSYVGTGGSYFKIYHKGSEYSKVGGDLKKHIEINKEHIDELLKNHSGMDATNYAAHYDEIWKAFDSAGKGSDFKWNKETIKKIKDTVNRVHQNLPYKVDFLKAEMDKVLRYEVSLSSKFFASAYKRYIFRANEKICPQHNQLFQMYNDTKNAMDSRTSDENPITPFGRSNYKMYHEWLNRSISLVVLEPKERKRLRKFETTERYDIHPETKKYTISRFDYAHTTLANKDCGLWSPQMLDLCVEHFLSLVKNYQITKVKPFEELLDKIKEYNKTVEERKANYNKLNHQKIKELVRDPKRGVMVWQNKRKSNGMEIKKAHQLLTQTQLRDYQLKGVNETLLVTFLKTMEDNKMSLDQVFKYLRTSKTKQYRIKKDLELFGVFKQTLTMEKDIYMPLDFRHYYNYTQILKYRQDFYADYRLHYRQSHLKLKIEK